MALMMIVFELTDKERLMERLDASVKKLGDPCHVLENAMIVKTGMGRDDIMDSLQRDVFLPTDRFLVAPLAQAWRAHNCRVYGECYEE